MTELGSTYQAAEVIIEKKLWFLQQTDNLFAWFVLTSVVDLGEGLGGYNSSLHDTSGNTTERMYWNKTRYNPLILN